MDEHRWFEASGTTDKCEHCLVVRYYEDADGNPTRRKATRLVYAWPNGPTWGRPAKSCPPCPPESGGTE